MRSEEKTQRQNISDFQYYCFAVEKRLVHTLTSQAVAKLFSESGIKKCMINFKLKMPFWVKRPVSGYDHTGCDQPTNKEKCLALLKAVIVQMLS